MIYKNMIVVLSIIFLLSSCKENRGVIQKDVGTQKWVPITISETGALYDQHYTSSSGKIWVKLTGIIEHSILTNDIQLPFMDGGFLIADVSYDKQETIEVTEIRTNALSMEDKARFKSSLNRSLEAFVVSNQDLRKKLPSSFHLNVPITSDIVAKEVKDALRYTMFDRCVESIAKGQIADTSEMSELWNEGWAKDIVQVRWNNKFYPINLTTLAKHHDQKVYQGCMVDDPYDDMFSYLSKNDFEEIWSSWLTDKTENDELVVLTGCSEQMQKFRWKDKTPQDLYAYVTYSKYADYGGSFILSLVDEERQTSCH